jgi:hypothetical protein
VELKFTPVILVPLTTMDLLLGVNTYPALLGVTVYVPLLKPLAMKFPEPSAVTLIPTVKVTVARFPPLPPIMPAMLHGQPDAAIAMLRDCVAICAGVPESVTCTVNVVVPTSVGVPVICPPGDKVSPGGKVVLLARDQLYGAVPPFAVKAAEYTWL